MNYTVFIQANEKQYIGALVAEYALKHNSAHAAEFSVRIMHAGDFPFLQAREGQVYKNGGVRRVWRNDALQMLERTRPAV